MTDNTQQPCFEQALLDHVPLTTRDIRGNCHHIHFIRQPARQKVPPQWSKKHPWIEEQRELAEGIFVQPIGQCERKWFIEKRRLDVAPAAEFLAQRDDDDGGAE